MTLIQFRKSLQHWAKITQRPAGLVRICHGERSWGSLLRLNGRSTLGTWFRVNDSTRTCFQTGHPFFYFPPKKNNSWNRLKTLEGLRCKDPSERSDVEDSKVSNNKKDKKNLFTHLSLQGQTPLGNASFDTPLGRLTAGSPETWGRKLIGSKLSFYRFYCWSLRGCNM